MRTISNINSSEDNPLVGILWMLLTMCLFVSMDTTVKYLSADFPPLQIVWARFFFHLAWLCLFLRSQVLSVLRSGNLKLQLLRSALLMMTTCLFFTGLRTTALSTATAIMFLSPIFVTLLAIPLLGETVGLRRLLGILTGFLGAMIIVLSPSGGIQDAADAVNSTEHWIEWLPERGYLLLISAAACNALYQILTRKLRMVDNPMTTLFYSALVGSVVMSFWVPRIWVVPSFNAWLLLLLVGLLGCVSHFCLIRAFRNAPASLIVPFSYSSLLWATLFGFVVFGALPDARTLAGATLIIASGLYIYYRENYVRKLS